MTHAPKDVRLEHVGHLSRQDKAWCVYLEHTDGRRAFYEATGGSTGAGVVVRYGRIGGKGAQLEYSYSQAIQKLGEKLAKGYRYTGAAGSVSRPVLQQPNAQRVETLRHRLGDTTMRPTTMSMMLKRMAEERWTRITLDADYTNIFTGCERLSLFETNRGKLYVVVQYGVELVWGCPDSS